MVNAHGDGKLLSPAVGWGILDGKNARQYTITRKRL